MWIQISSGKGPDECQLAVGLFLDGLLNECAGLGIQAEPIDFTPGARPGTYQSVLIRVKSGNPQADRFFQSVNGNILWICPSPYRPHCKRKNWFIDLVVLEERPTRSFSAGDVRYETLRSSGPGGQNVNKVETAVRAIHLPTGRSVVAREERTQHLNKKLALVRLEKLFEDERESRRNSLQTLAWSRHQALVRGNPIRVFEGREFKPKLPASNTLP